MTAYLFESISPQTVYTLSVRAHGTSALKKGDVNNMKAIYVYVLACVLGGCGGSVSAPDAQPCDEADGGLLADAQEEPDAPAAPLGCVVGDAGAVYCNTAGDNVGWFPSWSDGGGAGINCNQLPCEPGWACIVRDAGALGVCQ